MRSKFIRFFLRLDDNIGKMKRKWKEALNGVIIGVDAVEEDEEGGDEEEE